MEIRDYLRAIRRRWLGALVVVVICASLSGGYSLLQKPEYKATAQSFVSIGSATSVTDLNQGGTFAQQVVKSYAAVATTPYVLDKVISRLRLQTTPQRLQQSVQATAPLDTVVISISATDPSPRAAANIANAVADELASAVVALAPGDSDGALPIKVTQIQQAIPSSSPSSPRYVLVILGGLAVGIFLAIVFVALRELLDTRIHSIGDVEQITTSPVLGAIVYEPRSTPTAGVAGLDSQTAQPEEYRTLRTNLQFVAVEKGTADFVVTSSMPSEGKSTTAVNLAVATAAAGKRVLLVDADLRRPRVAEYLGVDGTIGLTDVLIGEVAFEQAVQPWGQSLMAVLPAGRVPPNPNELLQSSRMETLVEGARHQFDVVIFDTPPLLAVSDAAILAKRTSGALLVCAMRQARKGELRHALARLEQVGATVLGLVATKVPHSGPDAYGVNYYGYASDEDVRRDLSGNGPA